MIFKRLTFFFAGCLLMAGFLIAQNVEAAEFDYDLALQSSDIHFSQEVLISGETIRIYAKVRNVGNKDIVGYVSFFRGIELIGNSQAVSVLPGSADDVFVDFTVPADSFNIQAKVQGTEPADQNSSNNESQTTLIVPDADTDGDGVNDKADVFPLNAAEWQDTDADNIGDNADVDDDNDGWSDSQEQSRGTDPLRKDTDGDGVNDPQDYYPLDPLKSVQEQTRNIFQPPTNQATTQNPADGT